MATTVSYEVYSLREGHWNLDSVYDNRSLALDEARNLLKRRREKGAKVVKENYDDETNTSIPTTIFHEGEGVEKHRPQMREKRKHRERIETAAPKKEDDSGVIRHVVILVVSIGGFLLALIALAAFLMGAFGGGWAGLDEGVAAYKRGYYATALREWRPLAEQGVADAQFNLGFMYRNGLGVPQDYAEAVKWYRNAAEQGVAEAQYSLGSMYYNGQGVTQDYVQAHMWLNIAASSFPPGKDHERTVKNLDTIAKMMTPAQLSEAQKLAWEGRPKKGLPAQLRLIPRHPPQ